MAGEPTEAETVSEDDDATGSSAPGGQMIYHLFGAEERRRIISIYLDNHAVAFSAAAMSDATGMDVGTAAEMLGSLEAVGFLASENSNEAYQRAGQSRLRGRSLRKGLLRGSARHRPGVIGQRSPDVNVQSRVTPAHGYVDPV